MSYFKSKKGITLVILVLTIVIMLIFLGVIAYNINNNMKLKKLNNLYVDIKTLKDNVAVYYNKYGTLPLKELYQGNTDFLIQANIQDTPNEYYIIDKSKMPNLILTRDLTWTDTDVYIINTNTQSIYYPKGVEYEGEIYYTLRGE